MLHPGKRESLIDLFERELIESQEAVGIAVIGHFRDLADPNRFVWLRGFPDMQSRASSLNAFYHGAHWMAHRESANATMMDNDDVLLLRPARGESGFTLEGRVRSPLGADDAAGLLVATLYYFDAPVDDTFVGFFERELKPEINPAGVSVLSYFVSEYSANTFSALPVREGEHVFAWFALFRDQRSYDAYRAALVESERWAELSVTLMRRLKYRTPEVLRLVPASRSLLRE
jgi:NIPSNAP protein